MFRAIQKTPRESQRVPAVKTRRMMSAAFAGHSASMNMGNGGDDYGGSDLQCL
jgi:hypothetical protein